ncbi:YdcH family protein [Paenirhodobacter sp.]|jgi:hypothetical protein|uniref:YdcH family protein n=1 Tax=Paenirhodobacter sp. TaxID=1965326 RepID=UPI003B505573
MSLTSHIAELRRKHLALSEEVDRAHRKPGYDDLTIAEMKRQKLRIKEEITRLEQVPA